VHVIITQKLKYYMLTAPLVVEWTGVLWWICLYFCLSPLRTTCPNFIKFPCPWFL